MELWNTVFFLNFTYSKFHIFRIMVKNKYLKKIIKRCYSLIAEQHYLENKEQWMHKTIYNVYKHSTKTFFFLFSYIPLYLKSNMWKLLVKCRLITQVHFSGIYLSTANIIVTWGKCLHFCVVKIKERINIYSELLLSNSKRCH